MPAEPAGPTPVTPTGPGANRVVKPTPVVAAPVAPVPVPAPAAEDARLKAAANAQRNAELKLLQLKKEAAEKEKGFGAKLSKLSEYEKREARAKLDPGGYLEELYGKDWYDIAVSARLNNGAPTAGAVKTEIDKLRDEFEARLKAKDEEFEKKTAAQQQQSVEQARRQVQAEAAGFWESTGKEFPLLEGLGTPAQIAAELARRVEAAYHATTKRDESGRILVGGEILPLQKVAELWEGELVAVAEKAAASEKYAGRFKPKDVGQPQSRTLSNDLTGTTPGQRQPPASDEERRARAVSAYLAAARKT